MLLELLWACASAPAGPAGATLADVAVTADPDIGVVETIEWTTSVPADAWVDYGPDDGYGASVAGASDDDGTHHSVVLAGLAGGEEWHWRARSTSGTETLLGADHSFDPPAAPASLGVFDASSSDAAASDGGFTLTAVEGTAQGVVIFDDQGRPVWWREAEGDASILRARMSLDGRAVVYHQVAPEDPEHGMLVRVPLTGGPPAMIPALRSHHDFVEREDGGYTWLAGDIRVVGGISVLGDAVVEVDAEGGNTRQVWSIWDDRDPPAWDGDPHGIDWSHFNGLAYDPARDAYLVSSRNLSAIFSVSRETGLLEWQLGGDEGDFDLAGGEAFAQQHGPTVTPGGLLVFDNGDPEVDPSASEAAEYSLNLENNTYVRTWAWSDGTVTEKRGSAQRLANGDTLVSTGSAGHLAEVTAEGAVVWDVRVEAPQGFTFATHVDSLGGAP